MPDEDGYSLIRRLRQLGDGPRLPAIALTAYAAPMDRAKALSSGFQLHVAKPFDPVELARTVRRIVSTVAHDRTR
jgi:CheY-like chemotaxis protein